METQERIQAASIPPPLKQARSHLSPENTPQPRDKGRPMGKGNPKKVKAESTSSQLQQEEVRWEFQSHFTGVAGGGHRAAWAYRFTAEKGLASSIGSSKKDHYTLSLRNPPPGNLPKEGKGCEHESPEGYL